MENTPTFSLSGLKCVGKVLHVYDGDTLWLAVVYPGQKVYKYRVRLYGYDAPEIHPSMTLEHREQIMEAARTAKAHLESLLRHAVMVEVEFFAYDKYGRPLVNLRIAGQKDTINDMMVRDGFGYAYYGGKKAAPNTSIPLKKNEDTEEKNDASRSI